ncbi:NmrA family NAD(P)-binding protein [Arthrobacter tumbae]|uniref:SDR family oxidoreductase n=1 Tax=Arthrobacter tumbae TaxID=163874 RepID=UPI001958DA1B|nr:SDR family oxidoreductase [Arthrobacter tumbae]MBM7782220.1 NADH dehydrogenase [Arthrobacter tumbae]
MILIAGATGKLGGLIAQQLSRQGEPVRVLVRADPAGSFGPTVEVAFGDLKDPSSLREACKGVDAVITTANSTARGGADTIESVDLIGNRNLVDAAVSERVRRFIFISSLGAHPTSTMPLLRAKGETEKHLAESGMVWTSIQPNVYIDLLLMGVVGGPALSGAPVTLVGSGERKHSFVTMSDVAAYTLAALHSPAAENQTLRLGGPEPLSWRDVVAVFEQFLRHAVEVRTVPIGEPVPGMPDFIVQLLTALETYDSPMDMAGMAETYGVKGTSLREFLSSTLPVQHVA